MSEEQKERARERARAQAARVRVARRVGKNIMWCPDVGRWLIRDGERWIRGGGPEAEMHVSRALLDMGIRKTRDGHPALWKTLELLRRHGDKKAGTE